VKGKEGMKKAVLCATLKSAPEKVWRVVTDNAGCNWRSDLSKIEASADGVRFIEYTKAGFVTHFVITALEPYTRYTFSLENDNLRGNWTGLFREAPGGGTEMELTEEITLKKPWLHLFAIPYLKKQQALYLADLKKALGE